MPTAAGPLHHLSVRPCVDSDLDLVHELSRANMREFVDRQWGGWQEELFWADIHKDSITMVERLGKPVGFFDVVAEGDALLLRNIQVLADCRGRGIGKYIMRLIEEKVEKMRLAQIKLRVFVDNPAVSFYEHLGFCVVEKNESSLVMTKMRAGSTAIDYAVAQKEDEDEIKKLLTLLDGDQSDMEMGRFVIARDGNRLVGCVRTKALGGYCLELSSLGVLPSYQARGIGSRLVRLLLAQMERRPLFLLTSSDKESFYRRFGAEIVAAEGLSAVLQQEYDRVSALPFASDIRVIVMMIDGKRITSKEALR